MLDNSPPEAKIDIDPTVEPLGSTQKLSNHFVRIQFTRHATAMPHLPDFAGFQSLAAGHDLAPVYRKLLSDALTPVSALHLLDDGGNICLFESVIGGEKVGRYSFLALDPQQEIVAYANRVVIRTQSADGETTEAAHESANPLDDLRKALSKVTVARHPDLPPFTGGAVGYAGYDVVRYVERLPNAPLDDRQLPDLSFAFYNTVIVFDNVEKTMSVVALAPTAGDLQQSYDQAKQRIDTIVERLQQPPHGMLSADVASTREKPVLKFKSNMTQQQYEDAVRKSVEYIEAGDIFQVVLSQRLEVETTCDPFEIYRTLRVVNPSPFMFFLRTGETTLVGSSPEVMCRVADGRMTVRPLAGTRPRGKDTVEDRRLAEELLSDPKERAEHVMLVDLGRNDVGRVAKYGSVELTEVMVVERYSHVMHISSTVQGDLREGLDAFDALAASLPAGTVSGAPKVRAMEIIDELEPHRRGPYAGAVGYIDYRGNMDTCIALRTMVLQDGVAYIQAGAGLVADSVPESEYRETLNKAGGLLRAIEITEARMTDK